MLEDTKCKHAISAIFVLGLFLASALVGYGEVQNANDAAAYEDKGSEAFKAGQYKKAIEAFKKVVALKPNDPQAHYHLGDAYFGAGQFKDAVKAYNETVRLKPDHAVALNNLGTAYLKLSNHPEAIKSYQKAIKSEPDYAQAHRNLGVAYLEMRDVAAALKQYEILKTIAPQQAAKLHKLIEETTVSSGDVVLNGRATELPGPEHGSVARTARAAGIVIVRVVIDETGKVISALPVRGHPLLQEAAVEAAYKARFKPATANGNPMKVSGLIVYNFVLP